MKLKISCLLFFLASFSTYAQKISLSSDSLNFGTVITQEVDSVEVTINNSSEEDVLVTDIKLYNDDFSVNETSFSVPAQGNYKFWVRFSPVHNILYNTEGVVITSSRYGNLSFDLRGGGDYDDPYYSATQNKSEEDLKTALKTILTNTHQPLNNYTLARDYMYGIIDNKGGDVECVYTGRTATFNTRAGATANNMNTEHTYPRSKYDSNDPMFSDIHHLFPSDATANSRRLNYPFGVVTGAPEWQNGSKLKNGVFEPRDEHKGACARSMLYFVTRYQNHDNFLTSQETILKQWAIDFPPTQKERDRNDAIAVYQGNRSPFVDHPEFLERINRFVGTSAAPVVRTIDITASQANLGTVFIDDTVDFNLVIASTGNTAVNLSNVSFSGTDFTWSSNGTSVIGGGSVDLNIRFVAKANGTFLDTLRFFVTDPNINNPVEIPITASALTTGIADVVNTKDLFGLYPNPADRVAYLENKTSEKLAIAIFNPVGEKVYFEEITSPVIEIPLSNLASGIYFVKVSSGNLLQVEQLIVK